MYMISCSTRVPSAKPPATALCIWPSMEIAIPVAFFQAISAGRQMSRSAASLEEVCFSWWFACGAATPMRIMRAPWCFTFALLQWAEFTLIISAAARSAAPHQTVHVPCTPR